MDIYLSEQLKKLRKEKGNTQEDLARHLNISVQAVSKWERDEGFPDIALLPAIAFYYDVSVDDLLGVGKAEQQKRIQEMRDKDMELFRAGKSAEREGIKIAVLRTDLSQHFMDVFNRPFLITCHRITIEDPGSARSVFPQFDFIAKSEFRTSVSFNNHNFAVKDLFTKDGFKQKNTQPHMPGIFDKVKNTDEQIIFHEFESLNERTVGDIVINSIHFHNRGIGILFHEGFKFIPRSSLKIRFVLPG